LVSISISISISISTLRSHILTLHTGLFLAVCVVDVECPVQARSTYATWIVFAATTESSLHRHALHKIPTPTPTPTLLATHALSLSLRTAADTSTFTTTAAAAAAVTRQYRSHQTARYAHFLLAVVVVDIEGAVQTRPSYSTGIVFALAAVVCLDFAAFPKVLCSGLYAAIATR
jgi:hypothetical protein